MATAIEFNHVGKQYRLGLVSTGTISHDLNRWWHTAILRQEDPYLKIGAVNDRTQKADSDYVWALRDIDFRVEQGDVVGIIGKNGAGKSTLLKLLSKVTGPTVGTIRARGRIASLLEVGTGFHSEMTGRENIFMNGAILGMTKQEIAAKLDEIVDFSGCEKYLDTPVKRYSSGMMVRLGFAVAAHLDPEILVVDEVLAVGDAEFQKKAIGKMQDVSKGEGRTVLFVSHNMDSIRNLCTTGVLLENGMVKLRGDIDQVVSAYVSDNLMSVGDIAHISDIAKYRISATTKEYEILEIHRDTPYLVDSTGELAFSLRIRRNIENRNFQVQALIDDVADGGNRVGMATSVELIAPEKNEFTVKITLPKANLTRGKYIMDFWVGFGDPTSGIRYYDAAYDTVTFEVSSFLGHAINEWHSYWGHNCYELNTAIE